MSGRSAVSRRVVPHPGDLFAEEAVALVRERSGIQPEVGLVLGSGLGDAVQADLRVEAEISFAALPGFPPAAVPGHARRLVMGELYGVPAAVFMGRVHFYEGHGIGPTTLIPRLAAGLGVGSLILTNAAGGLAPELRAGSLMLIRDHLNLMGANPLAGWRFPGGGPAFVDLSSVYDTELAELARAAAAAAGVELAEGVYAAMPGPSYETPAETRFLRRAGADAVGMSTVPEAVAGVALGLRVLAISAVANAAGVPTSHQEVLEAVAAVGTGLRGILSGVIPRLAERPAARG
jgi:purine-nucleoside phosphorylase